MTQTESLKLIRFLSAIFQPFGNMPANNLRNIALNLFDSDIGEKIISEIDQSSQNIFCNGEILLTPKNIVSSIRQNIDKLKDEDFGRCQPFFPLIYKVLHLCFLRGSAPPPSADSPEVF